MNDVDQLLHDLGQRARFESSRAVDVRARVLQTLSTQPRTIPLDLSPIVFAGVSVVMGASFLIALLPTWMTLTDAWIAYLP